MQRSSSMRFATAFVTAAQHELMLPRSLTKRLVNHSQLSDVTEGYAADWTVEQLRKPVQLMNPDRSASKAGGGVPREIVPKRLKQYSGHAILLA